MPCSVTPLIAVGIIIELGDWLGRARLQREQIVFKQMPYALEV